MLAQIDMLLAQFRCGRRPGDLAPVQDHAAVAGPAQRGAEGRGGGWGGGGGRGRVGRGLRRAATTRFSRTVRLLKMRRPCGTKATPRAAISSGAKRVTAAPNNSTAPLRGGNSPTVTFMQVDLPAPLRPSRPRRRPSPSANDTLCST